MDRNRRGDESDLSRSASDRGERDEGEERDELTKRRQQLGGRQPLTQRERDERWPIG